jgi:hypothetical protein
VNQGTKIADCEISCGTLPSVRWEWAQEIQCGTCINEVVLRVEREGSPECVAAKKPGKAWPCSVATGSIARDEAGAQVRIVDHSLNHADARPVVGLLQLRVGQRHVHGFGQSVIRVFGFRGSIY